MGTVTVINTTPYKEQPVPEVGKEYYIFDDGKIKPSRLGITTVLEVIPFQECKDSELLEVWQNEVEECYWLYAPETDYFIMAESVGDPEPSYFVRTEDGGWFSLGWFGARLDIDGSLYAKMREWYSERAEHQ